MFNGNEYKNLLFHKNKPKHSGSIAINPKANAKIKDL